MVIVHLFASPFLGGPERQFLGLVRSHSEAYRSVLLSFAESGSSRPFVDEARRLGFEAHTLQWNHPRLLAAAGEVVGHLRRVGASVRDVLPLPPPNNTALRVVTAAPAIVHIPW